MTATYLSQPDVGCSPHRLRGRRSCIAIGVFVLGSSIIAHLLRRSPLVVGLGVSASWPLAGAGASPSGSGMALYILRRLALGDPRRERRRLHHVPRLLQAAERRPGAALRRQVPDAAEHRARRAPPAPRQAVLRRVLLLRQELRHRRRERLARPRLLVRQLRLGALGDHPARAADALPDRRRGDHLADRAASRSACISAVKRRTIVDRARDGLRALRDLCARVLARADGALPGLEAGSGSPTAPATCRSTRGSGTGSAT